MSEPAALPQGTPGELPHTLAQIRAFQAGDKSAADALFRRYYPIVKTIVAARAGKRVRDLDAQDDLLHDALLHAFRSLGGFEPRGEGSFRHWLAQIVQHRMVSLQRRELAQRRGAGRVQRLPDALDSELGDPGIPDRTPSPTVLARAHELEERREQALLGMSALHRELVNLREHCEMEFAEIAQVLGMPSADAARMAYVRANRRLREALSSAE